MLPIYLFSAILGGGLLLISMLGGDADGVDPDAIDTDPHASGQESGWKTALSFQTLAYALAAFGLTGSALTLLAANPVLTGLGAVGMGVIGGRLAALLFGWLRATESGFAESSDRYIGGIAETEIRIPQGGRGRIQLVHRGRAFTLPAMSRGGEIGRHETVVVVDLVEGVAIVERAPPELTY